MDISILIRFLTALLLVMCATVYLTAQKNPIKINMANAKYWQSLQGLCGNAYEGKVVAAPANDTVFANKTLIMHVLKCDEDQIKIPFFVGTDFSRTWVLTLADDKIELKHDHRHEDGTPDEITMYGGSTSNQGTDLVQFFPADQETASLLPAAAGNVWWIEIKPGEYFIYNLRRLGTDRFFSVAFDLKNPVKNNKKPWGWEY